MLAGQVVGLQTGGCFGARSRAVQTEIERSTSARWLLLSIVGRGQVLTSNETRSGNVDDRRRKVGGGQRKVGGGQDTVGGEGGDREVPPRNEGSNQPEDVHGELFGVVLWLCDMYDGYFAFDRIY